MANVLIILHAIFGALALLIGFISISAKKGGKLHRQSGKGFVLFMTLSALLALVISILPEHTSPFLFSVGIFSLYFTISGFRSIQYTKSLNYLWFDKTLSSLMIVIGILMISSPFFLNRTNVVMIIFGALGLVFAIRDWTLYTNLTKLKKGALKLHLGKITGGYISACTAFVVVNQFLPGIIGWIAPGVIGGFFINYWMRKVS